MSRRVPWLIGAVGVLSIVVGVAVFATVRSEGVGWTSYAPLDPASEAGDWTITFSDGAVLWTWSHAMGAGLVVLGLLVLAGLAGWLLGRRASSRP